MRVRAVNDEYRSRHADPLCYAGEIDTALARLASAKERTDPRQEGSEAGKDHTALSALLTADQLTKAAAGWAIDHVVGLSLAGEKMLPRQPGGIAPDGTLTGTKAHPVYIASRRIADDHRLEAIGGEQFERPPVSPVERRLILRNLIFAGACGLPAWLREEVLEALDALDSGQTLSILQTSKASGTDYITAQAQLRVVAFVKYMSKANGESEESIRLYLGSRVGRDASTLKQWETRLKKGCLGPIEVDRQIQFARNSASYVQNAKSKRSRGEHLEDDEVQLERYHEQRYGMEALAAAVAELKRVDGLRDKTNQALSPE